MLKIQLNLFLPTQNLFIGSIQIISGPSVGSVQLVVNVRLIWGIYGCEGETVMAGHGATI
ncbi:MAG: hypothetical protein WCL48_05665 [Betaproteobacteria bacterium]|jgi:hypothetical protein